MSPVTPTYTYSTTLKDRPEMVVTHVNGNRFTCTSQSGHEPYTVILTFEGYDVWAYCTCPASKHSPTGYCKHGSKVKQFAHDMGHIFFADPPAIKQSEHVKLINDIVSTKAALKEAKGEVIALKVAFFDLMMANAANAQNNKT